MVNAQDYCKGPASIKHGFALFAHPIRRALFGVGDSRFAQDLLTE